jgi:hypothetical protein
VGEADGPDCGSKVRVGTVLTDSHDPLSRQLRSNLAGRVHQIPPRLATYDPGRIARADCGLGLRCRKSARIDAAIRRR